MVFGWESLATIGTHGVGGDLLFVTAGFFWAMFGTLLRFWHVSGTRAIALVGFLSVVVYAPLYALLVGFGGMLHMSLADNLLQIVVQGLLAGMLPIYCSRARWSCSAPAALGRSRRWCRDFP